MLASPRSGQCKIGRFGHAPTTSSNEAARVHCAARQHGAGMVGRGARAAPGDAASGFLDSESPDGMTSNLAGFHGGLSKIGFVEAQNVTTKYHWAQSAALAPAAVGQRMARSLRVSTRGRARGAFV